MLSINNFELNQVYHSWNNWNRSHEFSDETVFFSNQSSNTSGI